MNIAVPWICHVGVPVFSREVFGVSDFETKKQGKLEDRLENWKKNVNCFLFLYESIRDFGEI